MNITTLLNDTFLFSYNYTPSLVEYSRAIRNEYGGDKFNYSAPHKGWITNSESIVYRIISDQNECEVSEEAHTLLWKMKAQRLLESDRQAQISSIKKAKDSDLVVPGLKGTPYPYQKLGIEFIVKSGGRCILGDDPGLGKTLQLIGAILMLKPSRSLIACPASMKYTWKMEVEKWSDMKAEVLSGKPTSEILYRVLGLLFFNQKIGGYCLKEHDNVHAGIDNPSILCLHCLEDRVLKDIPDLRPSTTKLFKESYKRHFSVIDTDGPSLISTDHGKTDTSLTVNNSSDITKDSGISGHDNSNGFALRSDISLGGHSTLEGIVGDSKGLSSLLIGNTSRKQSFCSICGSGIPVNEFSSGHRQKIIVVNYDILKTWFNVLNILEFSLLGADESHLLKTVNTIRTRAIRMLALSAEYVVMLSATQVLNRPSELFSPLNILDPKTWNNYYSFVNRYAGARRTRFGLDVSGATNQVELQQKLNDRFMRRRKEEVLPDLPAKVRVEVAIDLEGEHTKLYKKAYGNFASFLRENKSKNDEEVNRALQAEKLVRLNALREISVVGKVDAAIELIENIISSGAKINVFSSFNAPLDILAAHFGDKAVMITGKTSNEERFEVVKRFQTDPDVKVFLGGILSAGVGITLTASSNVLFMDTAWTPAQMAQAEDRAHRIGSEFESITIYTMFANGTIDDMMKKMLTKKITVVEGLTGEWNDMSYVSLVLEEIEKEALNDNN